MADNDYLTERQGKALQAKIADALKARIKGTIAAADAGKALVIQSDGTVKAGTVAGAATWDADKLAIARGFYEVVSSTEPTQTSYTASDGKTYPVVWVKPIQKAVPVLPEAPAWSDRDSTVIVQDAVGVDYKLTAVTKDGATTSKDTLITPGVAVNVKALTGLALPFTVKIEAVAETGYTMPTAYVWTHDYPDPAALVVLTSDTFTTDQTLAPGTLTNAALGGTATPYFTGTNGVVSAGTLNSGAVYLDFTGTTNFELEFDFIDRPNTAADPAFHITMCMPAGKTATNAGVRVNAKRADTGLSLVQEGAGSGPESRQMLYGSLGGTIVGHWKISVNENTVSILAPGATSPKIYTLDFAIVGNANLRGGVTYIAATNAKLDNIVLKRAGV